GGGGGGGGGGEGGGGGGGTGDDSHIRNGRGAGAVDGKREKNRSCRGADARRRGPCAGGSEHAQRTAAPRAAASATFVPSRLASVDCGRYRRRHIRGRHRHGPVAAQWLSES